MRVHGLTTRRAAVFLGLAAICGLIVLLYRPVLGGYIWDDDFGWLAAARDFRFASSFGVAGRTHFYRPLVSCYFALALRLVGYSPLAFHGLNIGWHVCNTCLLYLLGRRVFADDGRALMAALVFAVLPGIMGAVAWVCAVTALQMTMLYLVSMTAHLHWLDTGRWSSRTVSIGAFVGALLSHEGAVTLLPMLVLAQWLVSRGPRVPLRAIARTYWPFAIAFCVYAAIAYTINRANYVVTEGQYRVGLHVVRNELEYITMLFVGRHGVGWYLAVAAALVAVASFGTARARFAAAWLVITLLPYSLFLSSDTSRYGYLAAIGFSLLVAELVGAVPAILPGRPRAGQVSVTAWVLLLLIAGRFAIFTFRGTPGATMPGEPYRQWLRSFKQTHGAPLPRSISVPDPHRVGIEARSIQPMLQLEYGQPDLQVDVRPE